MKWTRVSKQEKASCLLAQKEASFINMNLLHHIILLHVYLFGESKNKSEWMNNVYLYGGSQHHQVKSSKIHILNQIKSKN